MTNYKLVLFDADDTLFDYEAAATQALPALFAHLGFPFDPKRDPARYRAANLEAWQLARDGHIDRSAIKTERFRRLFPEERLDYEAVSSTYLSYLLKFWRFIDGAEGVCRYLASECTLAIVTNGLPEIQKPRVAISPLSRYIPPERVFVGQEIGFTKPDPRIFEHAFGVLGHPDKSMVILVGDNLDEDVQGGINFGIDTCWVNRAGEENSKGPKATFTIRNLRELIGLL